MRKYGLIPLMILLLAAVVFVTSYPIIVTNLIVDEEPVVADIIIVPEGGGEERARTSAGLLHNGFSKSGKIMVSPLTDLNAPFYQQNNVSPAQILPENKADSTYENAVNTLALMEANHFTSAIIVSSDYHMLRTKLIYDRVNRKYQYDLTYVAAYQLVEGELVPWYKVPQSTEGLPYSTRFFQSEFLKYWGYLLGLYHFM